MGNHHAIGRNEGSTVDVIPEATKILLEAASGDPAKLKKTGNEFFAGGRASGNMISHRGLEEMMSLMSECWDSEAQPAASLSYTYV